MSIVRKSIGIILDSGENAVLDLIVQIVENTVDKIKIQPIFFDTVWRIVVPWSQWYHLIDVFSKYGVLKESKLELAVRNIPGVGGMFAGLEKKICNPKPRVYVFSLVKMYQADGALLYTVNEKLFAYVAGLKKTEPALEVTCSFNDNIATVMNHFQPIFSLKASIASKTISLMVCFNDAIRLGKGYLKSCISKIMKFYNESITFLSKQFPDTNIRVYIGGEIITAYGDSLTNALPSEILLMYDLSPFNIERLKNQIYL